VAQVATIIRFKDLLVNTKAEPPCEIFYGITKDTVPNASLVMGYTRSGPGMQNQRHYHPHSAAGQCKIKGNDKMVCGPDHDKTEVDFNEGNFNFIPRGEIHGAIGTGEANELVFCYPGVNSLADAGIVYMEPEWPKEDDA
jgi:quercetin dioxygenase-like cupin family protein